MKAKITGTLVWYYKICPREAWLIAHQLEPEREFDLLSEGRLNQLEHYERSMRELSLPGMKLDKVRREGDRLVVSEVKKSSRYLSAARLQLGYYLWRLHKENVSASGEILIPDERRREAVGLTNKLIEEVEQTLIEIDELIENPKPPPAKKIPFCRSCAYAEYCWS